MIINIENEVAKLKFEIKFFIQVFLNNKKKIYDKLCPSVTYGFIINNNSRKFIYI